ncbi:MAG TPA: hypothetical protein GXX26_09295 [Clostridiaceae bacterium]|jgi:hypothetical protein|nr:hypothetical protein [Clostridiaceae bacterium]
MKDYLLIAGFIIGLVLNAIGRKKSKTNALSFIGVMLMVLCIGFALPDMIRGFIDGFNAGREGL